MTPNAGVFTCHQKAIVTYKLFYSKDEFLYDTLLPRFQAVWGKVNQSLGLLATTKNKQIETLRLWAWETKNDKCKHSNQMKHLIKIVNYQCSLQCKTSK